MLRDLNLRRTYNTKRHHANVISEFFIPALTHATSYDRLTFTFSSAALSAAARGIAHLVKNGGTMRILAAPTLTETDQAAVLAASPSERTQIFESLASEQIESLGELSTRIEQHYADALSWMLASGRLELRFAYSVDFLGDEEGIFHPKVGIIRDARGDGISFSGSINETMSAWSRNAENFKVFNSWEPYSADHFQDDVDSFESYWNHPGENGIEFVDISDPLQRMLVQTAPPDFPFAPIERFEQAENPHGSIQPTIRDYQLEAIELWLANDSRGILQMATGSGKTFTAANAVESVRSNKPGSIVIAVAPNISIAGQWKSSLQAFDPVALYESAKWKATFESAVNDVILGARDNLTVVSILDRSSSPWFLRQIERLSEAGHELMLIADEVHNFGAEKKSAALSPHYKMRLGLSATPTRYFDEVGTDHVMTYFDGSVFEFSIQDALDWVPPEGQNPILCPFDYSPIRVDLDSESLREYVALTGEVARAHYGSQNSDESRGGHLAAGRRAEILKTAPAKIPALEVELKKRMPVKQAITYCFDKDQVNAVIEICKRLRIRYHIFRQDAGTVASPKFGGVSEREAILRDHASGKIDMLIGMQMLDEGIDLPKARLAFMLSSSGNAKEFVQRTGRVIRWSKEKKKSEIVDFLAQVPFELETLSSAEQKSSVKLMLKESKRMLEYVMPANNRAEVLIPLIFTQQKLRKTLKKLEEDL